jgi:serine protease Do
LKRIQFSLILLSFLIAFPAGGGGESFRLYPVPLLEMENILSRWMHESGYRVSKSGSLASAIKLRGIRENESWHIVLQSHSPLFSSLEAEYLLNGRANSQRIRDLWVFLDDYVAKNTPVKETGDMEIPPFLLRIDSMVCLRATSGNSPIQFSGFVVDKKGVIISTAHDLDNVERINVMLSDGRNLPGRLMKKDRHRDLALIRVKFRFASSVNLNEGRKLLEEGEKIYALTCSEGERRILSGLIAGPVRYSENLPLWQVEMETPLGSSGSPVFNREGKMVAMIKGRYRGIPSIGFLIPLETVVKFLNE